MYKSALITLAVCLLAILGTTQLGYSQDELHLSLIEDASGMFNERGYLKSNSFSLDGEEIINDFNGNLMWTRSLKYMPISQNGLHFGLKLTYNGSVSHTVSEYPGWTTNWSAWDPDEHWNYNCSNAKNNNLNSPEWILSLNGIAIQLFNFENEAVSRVTGNLADDHVSIDDDVATLVDGYHSCFSERLEFPYRSILTILSGDGSLKNYTSLSDHCYPLAQGEYRSYSKDDLSRGLVDSLDNFWLFMENGTRVRFEFYFPKWKTTVYGPYLENVLPQAPDETLKLLLPVEFVDRMGHSIVVEYAEMVDLGDSTAQICGRPVVTRIGDYEFDWGALLSGSSSKKLQISRAGEVEYTIDFASSSATGLSLVGDINRGYVSRVVDEAGRDTDFSYKKYRRVGKEFGSCEYGYDGVEGINPRDFNVVLSRLHEIGHPTGGATFYSYFEDPSTQWPNPASGATDSLEVWYSHVCGELNSYPCIKSDFFDVVGRDPYFTNMVVAKTRVLPFEGDVVVSRDSLCFDWTDNLPEERTSVNDRFFTTRLSTASDFGSNTVLKSLCTYAHIPQQGLFSKYEKDRGWSLKLLNQVTLEANSSDTAQYTESFWDIDPACDESDPYCSGTFLLDSVTTIKDDVSGTRRFGRVFNGPAEDPVVNNILEQSVKNELGVATNHYYNSNYLVSTETSSYYTNSLIDSTIVKNSGGTPVGKTENSFYDAGSPYGYAGQIAQKTEYTLLEGQEVDTTISSYEYVKGSQWPVDEGALKHTVDPNGNVTDYYFHETGISPEGAEFVAQIKVFSERANPGEWLVQSLAISTPGYVDYELNVWGSDGAPATLAEVCRNGTVMAIAQGSCGTCEETGSFAVSFGDTVYVKTYIKTTDPGAMTSAVADIYRDNALNPLTYMKAMSDGTIDTVFDEFSSSGPFWYKSVVHKSGGADSLVRYQLADSVGSVLKLVDANGFLSECRYDSIDRIEDVILPGHFEDIFTWSEWIPNNDSATPTFDAEHRLVDDRNFYHNEYSDSVRAYWGTDWILGYVTSIDAFSERVNPGQFDSARYVMTEDGTIDYTISVFSGLNPATEAEVYRNGILIDRLSAPCCGCSNSGTFEAAAGDVITVMTYVKVGDGGTTRATADIYRHTGYDWVEFKGRILFPNHVRTLSASQVDSAFLSLYCLSRDNTTTVMVNGNSEPVGLGALRFDVTDDVRLSADGGPQPAFWLSTQFTPPASPPYVAFYSSNYYVDPSKQPLLTVYYRDEIIHSNADSIFTLRYEYDDRANDGDPVCVTNFVRPDATEFTRKKRIWFDGFGRQIQQDAISSDGSYDSTMTSYDFVDRPWKTIDQDGNSTVTTYDALNRTLEVQYPSSLVDDPTVTHEYFGQTIWPFFRGPAYDCNSVSRTDENGIESWQFSDLLGQTRLTKISDGTSWLWTHFDYDQLGNPTEMMRPDSDRVFYEYNSLGQLLKEWHHTYDETPPDYDTVSYQYDKNGNMILKHDGNLRAMTYDPNQPFMLYNTYDELSRLTESGLGIKPFGPPGAPDFMPIEAQRQYFYDQYTSENSRGRLSISYSGENGYDYGEQYHYDARGRMTRQANIFSPVLDQTRFDSVFVEIDAGSGEESNVLVIANAGQFTNTSTVVAAPPPNSCQWTREDVYLHQAQDVSYTIEIMATHPEVCGTMLAEIRLNDVVIDMITCDSLDPEMPFGVFHTGTVSGSCGDKVSAIALNCDEQGHAQARFNHQTGPGIITFCLERENADDGAYAAVYLNDTLMIDSIGWNGGADEDEIVHGCWPGEDGDQLRVRVGKAESDDNARVYAMVGHDLYKNYQKYLRPNDLVDREYDIEYTYNGADQLTSIIYPGGFIVTYHYDDRGRLISVGDDRDADEFATYTYTSRDEIETIILGNNIQILDYEYNERGWLTSINNGQSNSDDKLFGQNLYYYSHPDHTTETGQFNGNLLGQKISLEGTDNQSYLYHYDRIDRLKDVWFDGENDYVENFSYNLNGNRLTYGTDDPAEDRTYYYNDHSNLLDSVTSSTAAFNAVFTYDGNGNIVTDDGRNALFEYDIYNQVNRVEIDYPYNENLDDIVTFGYNNAGQRVCKAYTYYYRFACPKEHPQEPRPNEPEDSRPGSHIERQWENGGDAYNYQKPDKVELDGKPVNYCYGLKSVGTYYIRGMGKVLMEIEQTVDGMTDRKYIYAGDQRIAMIDDGGKVFYYLNDHLGSARVVVAAQGGDAANVYSRYLAFGGDDGSTVSKDQPFRYTGKPFDNESGLGLYYYGARYYAPELGRFWTIDPLLAKYPSLSPFIYCANNPLGYVDPSGSYRVRYYEELRYDQRRRETYVVQIYYPMWEGPSHDASILFDWIPFFSAGLAVLDEEESFHILEEGPGLAWDIVSRTDYVKSLKKAGGKAVKGVNALLYLFSIYNWWTQYSDPIEVIEEYRKLELKESPCRDEACVHRRMRRDMEKADRQMQQNAKRHQSTSVNGNGAEVSDEFKRKTEQSVKEACDEAGLELYKD